MLVNLWLRTQHLLSTLRAWAFRGFLALLDQGLISGSNFIVAIVLARWLSRPQYGAYALAFEVFLFISILYSSLILEPMSVFGPSVYKEDLRGYMRVLLRFHWVISVAIIVGVVGAAAVLRAFQPASSLPIALIGVGGATPCLLLFWLARRGFYVLLMPQKAAWGACSYSLVMFAGLVIVYRLGRISPLAAFLMMAAGAILTAPAMLLWFKRRLPPSTGPEIQAGEVLRKHWKYGYWALGSATTIWFSAAVYYPLLGTFFGLAETAKFKALMNLASPIGQAFVAVGLLSLPYASRSGHRSGPQRRRRLGWKLTSLYVAGTSAYWLVVLVLRNPIVHHLYGNKYPQVIALVPWLAVGSILRMAATSQTIVLRSMNRPDLVFAAYSAACIAAIIFGILAARSFGIAGAVSAWVLSSGVAFLVAMLVLQRQSALSALDTAG